MHLSQLAGLARVLDQPLWRGVRCQFTKAHWAAAPTVVALVLMSTHGPPLMVLLIKLFELFCHKLKDGLGRLIKMDWGCGEGRRSLQAGGEGQGWGQASSHPGSDRLGS